MLKTMAPLLFKPLYQLRPWGGRVLSEILGREQLPEGPVGESWEVVDRPEAQSVVVSGPWAGRTLGSLVRERSAELMGPSWDATRPFPILVKWLDCRDRLSLQVHPSASSAVTLGGEPKTENWYLAHTAPGAAVLAGLVPGTTREMISQGIASGTLEPLVMRLPVVPGDSLFVQSGQLHAIDAGCLILEIQQNSDTTYRVYDWGRLGLDGKPRQMHVRESLLSINFDDPPPRLVGTAGVEGETLLADSNVFRLRKVALPAGGIWNHPAGSGPSLAGVVRGALTCSDGTRLAFGANALLPHSWSGTLTPESGGAEFLVTDRFA